MWGAPLQGGLGQARKWTQEGKRKPTFTCVKWLFTCVKWLSYTSKGCRFLTEMPVLGWGGEEKSVVVPIALQGSSCLRE